MNKETNKGRGRILIRLANETESERNMEARQKNGRS